MKILKHFDDNTRSKIQATINCCDYCRAEILDQPEALYDFTEDCLIIFNTIKDLSYCGTISKLICKIIDMIRKKNIKKNAERKHKNPTYWKEIIKVRDRKFIIYKKKISLKIFVLLSVSNCP